MTKRGPSIPKHEEARSLAIDTDAQQTIEAIPGAPEWKRPTQRRKWK